MKIYKNKLIKKLTKSYKKITGKNNTGKITIFHRGGGVKKKYKIIDFKKKFINVLGIVKRIEYNPLKKGKLSLICYYNGILVYNLLMKIMKVGSYILDYTVDLNYGSTYFVEQIPNGCFISSLEFFFNKKLQIIRAPGTKGVLLGKDNNVANIKLPSGKTRLFPTNCRAILGSLALTLKKLYPLKAGTNRNNNLRPVVRGVAMNPIDHPHGGGQGKTSGGRKMSTSPWSKYCKGLKPKKKKTQLNYFKK